MSRYVARPQANGVPPPGSAEDTWFTDPMVPPLYVDGEKQVDTGLVDRKGNRIFRLQDPIGFHRP
jgi:hypothetical protein